MRLVLILGFRSRKVVILACILHYRLKYFAESEELITRSIDHFTTLWDTLPIRRPFSVSVPGMIATTALLYLSPSLEFEEWIDTLKPFHAGLDLYINGLDDTESGSSDTGRNVRSTLELVLDRGVNVWFISFFFFRDTGLNGTCSYLVHDGSGSSTEEISTAVGHGLS